MISSDRLKAGTCYFFVTYEDRDPSVPVVATLRFKHKVSEGDAHATSFVFEQVGPVGPRQRRLSEDLLKEVFELDALVSEFAARPSTQRAGAPYEPRYCDD